MSNLNTTEPTEVVATSVANVDITAELPKGARAAAKFHLPELDVVRFVAFFMVFLCHVFAHGPAAYERYFGHTTSRFFAGFADSFAFGLCLFFFLSAYLISELLLREQTISGTIDIKRFYQRRALRIWPLYFLGVAIGLALDECCLGHDGMARSRVCLWFKRQRRCSARLPDSHGLCTHCGGVCSHLYFPPRSQGPNAARSRLPRAYFVRAVCLSPTCPIPRKPRNFETRVSPQHP
jgi:hypothetical protein